MLVRHEIAESDKYDVEIRESMKKFECEHLMLEICRPSSFSPAYLNTQIITLFETHGQIEATKVISEIGRNYINDIKTVTTNRNIAIQQIKMRVL